MQVSAGFFLLFIAINGALPAVEQPIDTLRDLKPVGDYKLIVTNQARISHAEELRQSAEQYAALLAEKKQLETARQELEAQPVVLQKQLAEQQNRAHPTEATLQQQLRQSQAGLAATSVQ